MNVKELQHRGKLVSEYPGKFQRPLIDVKPPTDSMRKHSAQARKIKTEWDRLKVLQRADSIW
jgi:hypothetical protein